MKKSITLHLQSAARYERLEAIASFVGQDASGSFGILPGRTDFMTVLDYGLARFRLPDGSWQYLACPGGVLSFYDDQLFLNTRRYLRDDDYNRVCNLLSGQLAEEELAIKTAKDNLQRLEQELFRRLHQLERSQA